MGLMELFIKKTVDKKQKDVYGANKRKKRNEYIK